MQALHVRRAGRLARIALIASAVLCLGGPASSAFADSSGPTITSLGAVFRVETSFQASCGGRCIHNRALRKR